MMKTDRFTSGIDSQINYNRGKNIFSDKPGALRFAVETIHAIEDARELSAGEEQFLIDYAVAKAMEEFCRVNQFYSFGAVAKDELRTIYAGLLQDIRDRKAPVEDLSAIHYRKLKDWLLKYNAFAGKMYADSGMAVELVPCAEYSAGLQLDVLGIDPRAMMGPVLDVGCGKEGTLVGFLSGAGVEAWGIDRFPFDENGRLLTADWLEYDYGHEKWGTVVSNLGFSNHFRHHHFRQDGNYSGYALTYMKILNSLKPGGCFVYAPDLPFVEEFLDRKKFELFSHEIEGGDFRAMKVIRKNNAADDLPLA